MNASDSLNAKVVRPTMSDADRYAIVEKLIELGTEMQLAGYDVTAKHIQHAIGSLCDRR